MLRDGAILSVVSSVTPVLPRNSKSGRGDWIRTSDPLRPSATSYDYTGPLQLAKLQVVNYQVDVDI